MRAFKTTVISALLITIYSLVHAQDCDLVNEQACCYVDGDNDSTTSYCCNGSIVGNPSSSDASALNDLTCCQDDGRTGINVGFDITTCRAGSATPLTAKGTAASSVADVIKSLSVSRSISRESLYSAASVSRASVAGATATATTTSTGSSSQSAGSSSATVSSTASSASGSSSTAAAAAGTTSSSSGSAAAAGSTSSPTGGVAAITVGGWNAAMAGGLALVAAAL
ncbi:hypothetical protein AUEXF2481DRAFT_9043 [Aureobasidium subglaciale EXF-2481]|uniref:Extracellular membrane protein CFEM domain-containing protein n=1 Tax=Aureobasidium subglaciale (strain EXF-2481) TaxID=1043005 RepID=A0A074Y9Q3_AURSE|nr:uncharacterized protein AUEXF2481DRAFT_9043 [Aureobasidium subglaciale EXF-2481]KAI5205291.1 hypothetical protein E4T38_04373 [Aureobasidium subglaciale]KAI5224096.1 hypothetical protein E4T40_04149 [Aureobasidium subglaciale]KAI5228356.1 hypothetical protein E4T41_03910 [Aureobasidium subglaciale]KAI5262966.1 hypothetical protein E4T46_04117 [Aureobasidium subglaciale]KEQ90922.1 hypothetical protein AUEXF2481DRAFT_9043 [Aureobasidium subglaciale EXF-2481]